MNYRISNNISIDNSRNYNPEKSGRDYFIADYNSSRGYDKFLNETGDYSI